MDIEVKAWLGSILNAIGEIEGYFNGFSPDFPTFSDDLKTKRAVERNIEIIGEAMNRVLGRDKSIKLTDSRKIVDTRNRIIHGYDSVSDEIVWVVVVKHLPLLKAEVASLLQDVQ